MALIKCPECGKEISSEAGHCVHCGYEFTVCPDCGAVLKKDVQTCPKCGRILKKSEPVAANAASTVDDTAVWNSRFEAQKKQSRTLYFVSLGVGLVFLAFIVICFVYLISWSDKNQLERMESAQTMLNLVKLAIAAVCILVLVRTFIDNFGYEFITLSISKTAAREKWNFKSYLKKHGNSNNTDRRTKAAEEACLTAGYWRQCPKAMTYTFLKSAAALVVCLVTVICGGLFASQVFERMIACNIAGIEFEFKRLNMGMLIGAVVCFVAELAILIAYWSLKKKALDNWKQECIIGVESEEQ